MTKRSHPFYIYLSISELKFLNSKLNESGLYLYVHSYHKHTSAYPFFENIYLIQDEPFPKDQSLCPLIRKEVIRTGTTRGLCLIYIDWIESLDKEYSLTDFLKKYDFKLGFLGHTGDWLGNPIYCLINKETIVQRRAMFKASY